MVVAIGLLAACIAAYIVSSRPRAALVLWVLVVAFVPFWAGISFPFYLPPTSIVGVLLLGTCLAGIRTRPNQYDLFACIVCVIAIVVGILGVGRHGDITNVLMQWILSYVIGRFLVARVGVDFATYAVVSAMCAAGVGATIEFFSDWNPYYSWVVDNAQFLAWGVSQERGGLVRAEWAFGHSIALGCTLAMCIPLAWHMRARPSIKTSAIGLLALGSVVSFSRAGMVTLIVALSLCFIFATRAGKGSRLALSVVVAGGAFLLAPKIEQFFEQGQQSNAVSAGYRVQLNSLIQYMNPLGLADGYYEPVPGTYYFHGFRSIDSTFVLAGVSYGWLMAVLMLAGVLLLWIKIIFRRGSSADVAVACVVPALFTVAPITQFGSFVWFMIGFAGAASGVEQPTKVPSMKVLARTNGLNDPWKGV